MRHQLRSAAIALSIFAIGSALAQDAYPTKPITLINPLAPGGVVDIVARALAANLQKPLKQPVIVVNRPGANIAIGTAAVANGPADGYTILIAAPALAAIPAIDELFGTPSLFRLDQLVPLAQISSDPTVIVAHPGRGKSNTNVDYVEGAAYRTLFEQETKKLQATVKFVGRVDEVT